LLVLVEGRVTEEAYLLLWKRRLRERVLVDIPEFRGTPMSLVEKAVELKKAEEKEERRRRGDKHDEYWCVFDVDTHPNLREAIELAQSQSIALAISNPCIELWFLLHFADQTAYLTSQEAGRLTRTHTGPGKSLSVDVLEALGERFLVARERARRLEEKHRSDGTTSPGNPSSGVWRLIDTIEKT
jgi:RloB-like protein